MKAYAVKALYDVASPDIHYFSTSEEADDFVSISINQNLGVEHLGYIEVQIFDDPIEHVYYGFGEL